MTRSPGWRERAINQTSPGLTMQRGWKIKHAQESAARAGGQPCVNAVAIGRPEPNKHQRRHFTRCLSQTEDAPVTFPQRIIPARRWLSCLLYTSDAADDLLCVDIGGRRI